MRQEAIKELADKVDFRQELHACGRPLPVSFKEFATIAESTEKGIHPAIIKAAYISSSLTVLLTFLALIKIIPAAPAIMMFLFQLAVSGIFTAKANSRYSKINKAKRSLKGYVKILAVTSKYNKSFKSKELSEISTGLSGMESEVKALDKLINEFDQRNSGLIYIIVNGFLLRDIILSYKIDSWFSKNANDIRKWQDYTSKLDVIGSFANFAFNNPEFVFPTITEDVILDAKSLCHPSIPAGKRTGNPISIDSLHCFYIVTGANMAGKSTFIRSVGLNMVLASCGSVVCASEFRFSPITLFTSMRTSDRLSENSSYFHAELQRLKIMKETAEKSEASLLLLDEILKGTNSKDKLSGSLLVLRTLVKLPVVGIAAAHDLELGNLASELPNNFKNLCFEFQIENDEMVFDYKLKPGISKNMNATLLLQKIFPIN